MRGGLWSSFSVSGAGTFNKVEPYCDRGQGFGNATVGVAAAIRKTVQPRIPDRRSASERVCQRNRRSPGGIGGGLRAIAAEARSLASNQAAVVSPVETEPRTALPGLVLQVGRLIEFLVVVDAERRDPLAGHGHAPAPPIWGGKNRAATLEKTMSAEKPWKFGTLTRPAYPGILELCHSIGK